MTRLATRKAVNRVSLSERQRERVITALLRDVPPPAHDGFILRVEQKLHLRGTATVTDALVDQIISRVLAQMQDEDDSS